MAIIYNIKHQATPGAPRAQWTAQNSVVLSGSKTTVGAQTIPGEFTFALRNSSGEVVDSSKNDSLGAFSLKSENFPADGVYTYYIDETVPSGWIPEQSGEKYPVVVNVAQDSSGNPAPYVTYPNGRPSFVNRAASSDNGIVRFPELTFTEPGIYTYTIRESTLSGNGWTTDSREYTAVVTVVDDGGGNLVATVTYPEGYPEFVDFYNAAPSDVSIAAYKTAVGAPLSQGQFQFGLFDENGTLVSVVQNDNNGNILFPTLQITEAGIQNFTIRELTPGGNGWNTDSRIQDVTVTTTDDGMGQLVSEIDYPGGIPTFFNIYIAEPSNVIISAYKQVEGWSGSDPAFWFDLFDSEGNVISTVQSSNGVATFTPISYTAADVGTHVYYVSERNGGEPGWSYDNMIYPVVVTVTDNGIGQIVTSISYPEGMPVFTNSYSPGAVEVTVHARKTAEGAPLYAGQFKFGIFDVDGNLVTTATNDADGNIVFDSLVYTEVGTWNYVMRELTPSGNGWTTDSTAYPFTVVVTDNLDGTLSATLSGIDGGEFNPEFRNYYNAAGTDVVLSATKTAVGGTLIGGQFRFEVLDQNGNVVATGTNTNAGSVF